ncbi:MAG: DUF998 domain-containing protein [Tunicatimonas sp.]
MKTMIPQQAHLTGAGLLFFLAGSIILMGIITGEIFYPPGYGTALNDISDLGGTRPPNSVVYEPSATIFNVTMIVAGLLILGGTWAVHRYFRKWLASTFLALFGLGVLGVGIFPGHVATYHGLFSMLTFTSGGISAIVSFRMVAAPYRYLGIVFGTIALVFLFAANSFVPILGSGGTERWVAYPILLWLIGLGGYLLGAATKTSLKYAIHETEPHRVESARHRHRGGRAPAAP